MSFQINLICASLLALGFFLNPRSSFSASQAKICGYLQSRSSAISNCELVTIPSCVRGQAQLALHGELRKPYDLYLLLLDAEEDLAAVEFGLSYGEGLIVLGWNACTQVQLPIGTANGEPWPKSGSGNLLVFANSNTQKSVPVDGRQTVVLGSLYVYAYGDATLEFERYPRARASEFSDAYVAVANSEQSSQKFATSWLIYPDNHGVVSFGAELSRDPCKDKILMSSPVKRDIALIPSKISLSHSSPNPFRSTVSWEITSSVERDVDLTVYSVTGEVVKTYNTSKIPIGKTRIIWDGRNDQGRFVSQGKYYLVVRGSGGYKAVQNAILVR